MCTMMVLIDGFPEDVPEARAFADTALTCGEID